eukprot:jgi/Mesen1/2459/ME000158S01648
MAAQVAAGLQGAVGGHISLSTSSIGRHLGAAKRPGSIKVAFRRHNSASLSTPLGQSEQLAIRKSAFLTGGAGVLSLSASAGPQRLSLRRQGRGGALVIRAAVFDQLNTSLEKVWEKLKSQEKLTRDNVKEPMREIRRALLEADVSLPVVRRFVRDVTEKAVGIEVVRGVRPDQQLVKGKKCLMVATDVYRPAAIDQLITLGSQVDVPVFSLGTDVAPAEIARRAMVEAKEQEADVIIVDTAGRLQVNAGMMDELRQIKKAVNPTEVLLVVDAMTGQEAAGLVAAFNTDVGITGAILTKLDGDSRGGAALSVSGKPIKFVGEGEGMTALDPFYPDRMAGRILGMGDVLSLVEKQQELMMQEDQETLQKKIMEAKFDFDDFLKQTKMVAQMGSMGGILKYIPGAPKLTPQQIREAEKSLKIVESIIASMTPEERKDPELLAKSPSRRRRVAKGSGRGQEQVSQLVSQLFTMRAQMQKMSALMTGNSLPGIPGLDDSGEQASPGTAKRKKSSRTGFSQQLAVAQQGSRTKGFGAK